MKPQQTINLQVVEMLHEAFGPDIIRWLYLDDTVVEIEKNPDGKIWIDRLGVGEIDTGITMDVNKTLRIINIVAAIKKTSCDRNNPTISASIPGTGERFEGLVPPAAEVPYFTIRKHVIKNLELEDYVEQSIMTNYQKQIIINAVLERRNIIVSGSTSSGKSTLTNAIIAKIPKGDRVLVIEDTKELKIVADNHVRTYITEKADGKRLLKSAMRQNPKRIVVGEVRDEAALDLIMAWNTGHPGGVATIHANSALDALYRLQDLISLGGKTIEPKMIGRAVGLIIHIEGSAKGRKIKEIVSVDGYSLEKNDYILKEITNAKGVF